MADNVIPLSIAKTPADQLTELRTSNLERLQALGREGFVLDPITMLKHRLDVVTSFVTGDDEEKQIKLELAYEGTLTKLFDEVEEHINRAKLLVPGGVQMSLGDVR